MRKTLLALGLLPVLGAAQLTPVRAVNGIDRPLELDVVVPHPAKEGATIEVQFEGERRPRRAWVRQGRVNLYALFPSLQKATSDAEGVAQLWVGGRKVGAPVTIRPIVEGGMVEGFRLDR